MLWLSFSSPANLFRFQEFHFLCIAFLLASQKVSVIPPDFIHFYLANVDSHPSSYMSHMKPLQPLLCKQKKKKIHTFILPQNLVVQHHQHCLAIRVQYLSEPKKLQPTVPPKPRCSRAHLHWLAVLALRAGQSPSPRAGSNGLVPLCPPKHITAPTPSTELETDAPTRLM